MTRPCSAGTGTGGLVLIAALGLACGPGTRTQDHTGGGSGGSTGGASTGSISMSDTGVPFACPGARWHDGNLQIGEATDIDALRDVGGVTGWLAVSGTNFADLEFLSCLELVGGNLSIRNNSQLRDLRGLEQVRALDEGLFIAGNDALEKLGALESLETIGHITLMSNPRLVDIGLPALRSTRRLTIGSCDDFDDDGHGNNASLAHIGDFPALESLRDISISGQTSVVSLSPLVALAERGVEIGGAEFRANPLLSAAEIDAFAAAAGITPEVVCENLDDDEEEECGACLIP